MGMFDSLHDEDGHEWQTKAFDCNLDVYKIGDRMSRSDFPASYPHTYQVEVLGGDDADPYTDSCATVCDGILESVHDPRDESLPLINYCGHLTEEGI